RAATHTLSLHDALPISPAGNVVTDGHRALLAEGLAGDALGIDAAADQVIDHDRGAAGAEGDIVFTGAALVGMAFDHDAVIAVLIDRKSTRLNSSHVKIS